MKTCKRCSAYKIEDDFYANDSTCKECRKAMVRENRARKANYYREYDRKRFKEDPRVRQRHIRYQSTERGKESLGKSKRKYIDKNPAKRAAHAILGNAVRDGRIEKPSFCENCGTGKGRIHGHHDDYAYPLSVRWLCPKCHTEWHAENGEAKNG